MSVTYSWKLLRAGEFRLDAGSMFGLIPKVVWSRNVPIDDRGRVTLQHNCLLLEGGGKRVLLEAGTGNKLDPKSRDIFALENRCISDALHEIDCSENAIDLAIISHMHFDHAGGLTRLPHTGETPDWTGPGSAGDHGVKVTLANARVVCQSREWDDAIANRSVMTRTYFRDHLEPLRERMVLVDSPRPFPTGVTPDRDESPSLPLDLRITEVHPGIRVFLTPGHTWGQQATMFTDTKGRTVVFTPDVMPTAWHVGQAFSLGYDVEPYTSMVSRGWLLETAAERDWLLVLDHEPGNPCRRVRRNDKGWYDLVEDGV